MNLKIIKDAENPIFARVIIAGNWQRNFHTAKDIVTKICQNWPEGEKVKFLLTCSGFIDFEWPEIDETIRNNWYPDRKVVDILRLKAEEKCKLLLDDELRLKLSKCADYLSIGIDGEKFSKLCY
jgi:hypothetical protein